MSATYSVVIPAYNAERTIETCLICVAGQTLKPLQVVVIDDHSSDGTQADVQRCEGLLAEAGIPLEYIQLVRNCGPSFARNRGIKHAKAHFIAFLDADDVWAADKLEIVDRFANSSDAGLVFHRYTESSSFESAGIAPELASGFEVHRLSIYSMLLRNRAQTSSVVARRQPQLVFNETMRYCEDHDLWLRIAERSQVLYVIGRPLTRLGRPQLSQGGLSENTMAMRAGQMRVFYNFCRRGWLRRIWLLPGLLLYSLLKHVYSSWRRQVWRR